MPNELIFFLIPLIGYVGLWLLGAVLFLFYFRLFKVQMDFKHPLAMIKKLPPILAVITVPLCSFASFFVTTKVVLMKLTSPLSIAQLLQVGLVSLLFTIILDLLIKVVGEKVDIRISPINLMYLFAWLAIIPAIVLA